jgi:hypothetical protein
VADGNPRSDKPTSGGGQEVPEWDKNQDGIPDALNDPSNRAALLRKYGYTEADLKSKAKRDLFYEAVRKDYTRKEAKKAYGEVYVNDQATVRDIVEKSGFTWALIQSSPELKDVFRKLSDLLARGVITEDPASLYAKFRDLIDSTDFGRRTDSEIAADLDRYQKGNGKNWNKRVSDMVTVLKEYVTNDSGLTLDDAAAQQLALDMIYAGEENDPAATRRRVGDWYTSTGLTGGEGEGTPTDFGGQMGTWQDQLTRWFSSNGVTYTANELNTWLSKIRDGGETVDSVKQWYRDKRFSIDYGGFADEFAQGFDVADIAMSYRQTMADLLERDINTVDLSDPMVQRAMQNRGDDGKPKPLTKYEFERLVRQSPDWDKTTNAMSAYTDIGESILRSFGFRG